jgi:glycosyltransferase involved in cell wall biosynthesis
MAKKVRIGLASIQDASSRTTWSGTPFNILQELRNIPDIEVELISPLKTSLKWIYAPQKLRCRMAKENYDWNRESGSLRYFAAQIEKFVREKKIDVVFSTSSIPVTELNPSIPFVFWTDAVFHTLEGYYPGKWAKRTSRIACAQEERALSRAAFSCYSSHWAANTAMKFTSPNRVKVLPFGPNLHVEHERDDVLAWIRERRKARPQGCNLLFVGMDWLRKGGPVAVETARQLNEGGVSTTLRIVGQIPPTPLPPFVESVGLINKNRPDEYRRLVDIFKTADILILPSRAECSAIVLAEAAAFGLPVLTCDTGGLADYVANGKNGFRVPVEDDGSSFAESAKVILSDYGTFARNAYAEFKNRLNWQSSVNLLAELLKQASSRETELEVAHMQK